MHLDWGIVRTHRGYDGQTFRSSIYKTIQPKHPHSPICWYKQHPQGTDLRSLYMEPCPTRPKLCLCLRLRLQLHASPLPSRSPQSRNRCVKIPPTIASYIWRYPRHWKQFCWSQFFDLIQLTIFDLIRLNWGFVWLDSIMVSIWLDSLVFSIRFDSRLTYLFSTRVTQFESHTSQASGSPTLPRVSSKYSNAEIVEIPQFW